MARAAPFHLTISLKQQKKIKSEMNMKVDIAIMKPNACYSNAGWIILDNPTVKYVIGLIEINGSYCFHAWNERSDGEIFDVTNDLFIKKELRYYPMKKFSHAQFNRHLDSHENKYGEITLASPRVVFGKKYVKDLATRYSLHPKDIAP